MNTYTEDALIEQPSIALFKELGWDHLDCFHERFGPDSTSTLGRETSHQVVLVPQLRAALQRLNPGLSPDAIEAAITQLTLDRSVLSLASANREVHALLYLAARKRALPTDTLEAAEAQFRLLYPAYNPKLGIRGFLQQTWKDYCSA